MPPRTEVIQTEPITLHFDAIEWRGAFVAARATTADGSWQKRIDAAQRLQPQTQIQYMLGAFLLTSPSSGKTYTVSPGKCECAAWREWQSPCWHRVLPRLVRRIWARYGPLWTCCSCLGPVIDTHAPGGDRVCACLVCDHTIAYQFKNTLAPWSTATVLTLPERITKARSKATAA